jgi:hypothetical protein
MITATTLIRRMLILATIIVNLSFFEYPSKEYILSAKTRQVYTEGAQKYLLATVILTNNTSDTLKYLSWSCSYWAFYRLKSEELTWADYKCPKNLPRIKKLPPHRSDSVSLTFKVNEGNTDPIKYTVGMELAKDEAGNLGNELSNKPLKSIIIWTDEVIYTN